MCRHLAYLGPPLRMNELLSHPSNSLIAQSRDAQYHPGCPDKRNIRVNGDGFGLAFYDSREGEPRKCCLIKIGTPAWSNPNLKNLADHVRTSLLFAHVRAASDGSALVGSVSYENCHPFRAGRWTFMHNGGLAGFGRIRRRLMSRLSDESFHLIEGSTDSEYIFAIFMDVVGHGERDGDQMSPEEMGGAVEETIRRTICWIEEAQREMGISPCPSAMSLNLCVTDGVHMVATRYRNHPTQQPPSLYYLPGTEFSCVRGHLIPASEGESSPGAVIISSEPLCHKSAWSLVPTNHMVVVGGTSWGSAHSVTSLNVVSLHVHPSDRLCPKSAELMSGISPYLFSPGLPSTQLGSPLQSPMSLARTRSTPSCFQMARGMSRSTLSDALLSHLDRLELTPAAAPVVGPFASLDSGDTGDGEEVVVEVLLPEHALSMGDLTSYGDPSPPPPPPLGGGEPWMMKTSKADGGCHAENPAATSLSP